MKKYIALTILALLSMNLSPAQSRGVKIGFIDMEYILENVSSYNEAKDLLDKKATTWKKEIESRKNEINKLKEALNTEKTLLTKELINEREEEIAFQESELFEFQQKKFGPNGEFITQKSMLVKPVQDQVFTAVQDIAELKKYDFVFDKSSDLTMLFAAKRFNISDQIVRKISRLERKEQLTKKQLKEEEAKDNELDAADENPELAARKKALEERKLAREKLLEERKAAAEKRKQEQEDRIKKLQEEREAKKSGMVPDSNAKPEGTTPSTNTTAEEKAAERTKLIEDRKKELEEKRKKILEEREAAKKAREEQKNN